MTNNNILHLKINNYPKFSNRLDKWIAEAIKLLNPIIKNSHKLENQISRTRIKFYIQNGNVSIDGNLIKDPSHIIKNEEDILITIPEPISPIPEPEKITLDIIYEDKDILVLNKQSGLVVHPAPGNETGTLVNGIIYHCKDSLLGIGGVKRPGIVHRLDKNTSGLMIVAKSEAAHINLVKMFQNHDIDRTYTAIVWNLPKNKGTIKKPIGRSKINRKKMAVSEKGKKATTHWTVLKNYSNIVSMIECKLETGRTHQIRVHMAYLGFNLVGDQTYGINPSIKNISSKQQVNIIEKCKAFKRQALHSSKISFKHPISHKKLSFSSNLPNDIKDLLSTIK